jgi:putative membrane protein
MNYGHFQPFSSGLGAGFWILIILIGIAAWALVALGIVWLVRSSRHQTPAAAATPLRYPMTPAEAILSERFARGEIDEDEFRARMTTLRGGPTPPPPPATPPAPPADQS